MERGNDKFGCFVNLDHALIHEERQYRLLPKEEIPRKLLSWHQLTTYHHCLILTVTSNVKQQQQLVLDQFFSPLRPIAIIYTQITVSAYFSQLSIEEWNMRKTLHGYRHYTSHNHRSTWIGFKNEIYGDLLLGMHKRYLFVREDVGPKVKK